MADCKPEVLKISGMERHIAEIRTVLPTFSNMPETMAVLPTLPDVGRLVQFKMAGAKPEVHCMSGME